MSLRRSIRWLLFLVICTGIGFFIWQRIQPEPVNVRIAQVERGIAQRLVANTRAGTVNACRKANLSPGIGGQIALLPGKKGEQVSAGQLLVELWNKDLAARAQLARSETAAAVAHADSIGLKTGIAEREAKRIEKLWKASAVSDERLDQARTNAKILKAEHIAALAAGKTSIEQQKVIEAEFERTRLIAPFAGIIAEINGELNEYVTPSPPGIATPPTVILLDTTCFYVTAPIDEVDAAAITVNMPAGITLDAYGERVFQGTIRRIDPYVLDLEKQARTVDVEVEFTTPEETTHFLAGYSADVEIIVETHPDTLRIPTQAVLDGKRVFVFDSASRLLHEREVTIGISNWDVTEILQGLREGELIVLSTDRPGIKDKAQAKIEEQK
jgi:HlyD family secretion protein